MNQLYGNEPAPVRFNTQKYLQGGRVGMKRGGRGFGLKKVQKAGMEAAQAYFKNRPVEVPTPTFEGPPGKVKSRGSGEVPDPYEGYSPDLKADKAEGGLAHVLGV